MPGCPGTTCVWTSGTAAVSNVPWHRLHLECLVPLIRLAVPAAASQRGPGTTRRCAMCEHEGVGMPFSPLRRGNRAGQSRIMRSALLQMPPSHGRRGVLLFCAATRSRQSGVLEASTSSGCREICSGHEAGIAAWLPLWVCPGCAREIRRVNLPVPAHRCGGCGTSCAGSTTGLLDRGPSTARTGAHSRGASRPGPSFSHMLCHAAGTTCGGAPIPGCTCRFCTPRQRTVEAAPALLLAWWRRVCLVLVHLGWAVRQLREPNGYLLAPMHAGVLRRLRVASALDHQSDRFRPEPQPPSGPEHSVIGVSSDAAASARLGPLVPV